ncbi:MAG: SufD family Fe-S cluster assembly protein, partial [Leptospiraceae bacterium]|nr:SufD family Fe-S cluster assembly protein [Leptospiraceae bacterium]
HALILYVERTPAAPIRLRHTLESGNAILHRVFIATAPSVEVTVLDEFTDAGSDESQPAHLWNPETHIQAGANSQVRYISHRNYAAPVYHFHRISSEQARDSQVHVSIIHSGGLAGKGHVVARMLEPGARYRGIGICSATNREFHNMEMLVEHHASHTESSLLYKTVLKDRAHSVFDGNLFIKPGVKHVDSLQVNNNILMNRRARAESLPRLVIRAEDVSCEHGATVGELDKDALFFLMARGLTEEQARTLLIEGFLTGVIEEIPLDAGQIEIFLQEMKDKLAL